MGISTERGLGVQRRMESQAMPRSPEHRSGFPDLSTLIKQDTAFWEAFTGKPVSSADKPLGPEVQSKYFDTARKLEDVGGVEHWKAVFVPHDIPFSPRRKHPGQLNTPPEMKSVLVTAASRVLYSGIYFVNTTPQALDSDGNPYYVDDPLTSICEEVRKHYAGFFESDTNKRSRFGLVQDPLDYIEASMALEQQLNIVPSNEPITWLTAFALSHRVPELTQNILPEMYGSSFFMDHGQIMRGQAHVMPNAKQITLPRDVSREQLGFRPILHFAF